jgi:hypothetical protein
MVSLVRSRSDELIAAPQSFSHPPSKSWLVSQLLAMLKNLFMPNWQSTFLL